MFGLTGGALRLREGLESTVSGTLANFPEGPTALAVMVRGLQRAQASGRIAPIEPVLAAGQFLSATHGYLLLEIAGAFGRAGEGLHVMRLLGVNLMVGLGDERDACERSMDAALRT